MAEKISYTERVLDDFAQSVDAPKELTGGDAFKAWAQVRLNSASILQATRHPGTDDKAPTLDALLSASANQNAATDVRKQIQKVFEPGPPHQHTINKAYKKFEEDFQMLSNAVKNVPTMVEVRDLPEFLKVLEEDALADIKKIQEIEVAQLKEALKDNQSGLQAKIQLALNLSPAETQDIAHHLINKLEDSHKEANKRFEETLSKSRNELNKQIGQERQRIAILKRMSEDNEKIEREIANLRQKHLSNTGVSMHAADTSKFKKVTLRDITGLVTITGRSMKIDTDSKGEATKYSLGGNQMSDYLKRFASFIRGGDKDLNDLIALAQMMRADGVESVTMTIRNTPDKEMALTLARKTYRACILAGYPSEPEEKINIIWINGEGKPEVLCGRPPAEKKDEKKPFVSPSDQLFTGHLKDTLTAIHERGKTIRSEEANSVRSLKSTQEIRKELDDLRRNTPPPTSAPTART